MSLTFEEAEKNLQNLINWYSINVNEKNRNEATTRRQLIDRLFFECLGWEQNDCISEESLNGQFIDYSFKCPSCLFIVEAKKEGIYFELPIELSKKSIKRDIKFFLKNATDIGNAIEQAMKYCQSHGTPFGAVCNGHQVIAFIASRNDGLPPLEGKALVFDSLQSLSDNFLLAWQCLSKAGIMGRRLAVELQDTIIAPVPDKLSTRITDYPGFKQRNTLQDELQILSELFIEDLASLGGSGEEEYLRECYCKSGALSQYASVSKDILKTRYSALFEKITKASALQPANLKKGPNPELVAKSLSRRPILIVGDTGVGKTMFLKHFYKIDANEVFINALVCYVDFGKKPAIVNELENFTAKEIKHQLLDSYNIDIDEHDFVFRVLRDEVKKFEKGIYKKIRETTPDTYDLKLISFVEEKTQDKDRYLQMSLEHISKGHRKQTVIFLDNVDQRPDEFQEKVFLIGQAMADNWPVTVFISIRPETFYRSRVSGTLSGYHARAFTVSPPRVDKVVVKRLNYGISLIERGAHLGLGEDISVKSEKLKDYLRILVYSFEKNKDLMAFLDNMCGGNIRLALDFVKAFIGSGHVDTDKILNTFRQTGSYTIPLHEFLRAVTFGDNDHYHPTSSEILNLFDISAPDGRQHFLSPMLLAQLEKWSQGSVSDGFIHNSEIFGYLQSLGFQPNQIEWSIKRLLLKNLIESPPKSKEFNASQETSYYRVTSIGAYYVKKLISKFTYIDAMIVDTPIVDSDYRNKIMEADRLSDRLPRASVFCDYLDHQWLGLSDQQLAFEWPRIRKSIHEDIESITGKIMIVENNEESS